MKNFNFLTLSDRSVSMWARCKWPLSAMRVMVSRQKARLVARSPPLWRLLSWRCIISQSFIDFFDPPKQWFVRDVQRAPGGWAGGCTRGVGIFFAPSLSKRSGCGRKEIVHKCPFLHHLKSVFAAATAATAEPIWADGQQRGVPSLAALRHATPCMLENDPQ